MSNKQCQFSATQRAFVVTSYLKTNSIKQAQISYAKEYQLDRRNKKRETFLPGKTSIYRWVSDLKRHGSLENKNPFSKFRVTNSGRRITQRTPEKIDIVRQSVQETHKKSIRRRSLQLGIPRESLRKILKIDLKFKPYTIEVRQRLTDAHKEARVEMCRWFLRELREDDSFHQRIWFSDEAHFYLNGHVNNKNYVFWDYPN